MTPFGAGHVCLRTALTAVTDASVLKRAPGTPRLFVSLVVTFLGFVSIAFGAETLPPAPQNHFNDYAQLVRPQTANQLNAELAQLERDTSNQILVAIYPRMQSDSSVEDYTVRLAQSWRVGQKAKDNGAVLFVFQESRDVRIVTGYGLEGALPDALCKQIIENEIIPQFRAGNFDAGLTAGVRAMIAATRGEYRGTGRLNAQRNTGTGRNAGSIGGFIVLLIVITLLNRAQRRGGTLYGRRGRRSIWFGPGGGTWGGGGIGRRGGFGGGGGGTFSGGGGSFGGGGAGGRW